MTGDSSGSGRPPRDEGADLPAWPTPPDRTAAAVIEQMRASVWHRPQPPRDVREALRTHYRVPVPPTHIELFAALDRWLRTRGWLFLGGCSGPEILTWVYPPSTATVGPAREPVTTLAATLDQSFPTDVVTDCEAEITFAGRALGTPYLAGISGVTRQLPVIEAHRAGDPIAVPFPAGHARTAAEQAIRVIPG